MHSCWPDLYSERLDNSKAIHYLLIYLQESVPQMSQDHIVFEWMGNTCRLWCREERQLCVCLTLCVCVCARTYTCVFIVVHILTVCNSWCAEGQLVGSKACVLLSTAIIPAASVSRIVRTLFTGVVWSHGSDQGSDTRVSVSVCVQPFLSLCMKAPV